MSFGEHPFDLIHIGIALHEMDTQQLEQILKEVYRVLKPNGIFTLMDFYQPTNPLFWPPLAVFMWLSWQLLQTDLIKALIEIGFKDCHQKRYAGGKKASDSRD